MHTKKDILYSIIIPHKNIPDLLKRCIKSIPCNNDIEIIVVDDNSDKEILDSAKLYLLNEERTNLSFIYTKEGKGAGYARNIGLKQAIGKWILFADADDFFHEKFYSIIEKYRNTNHDVIFFHTYSVISDTLTRVNNREDIFELYLKKQDINLLRYVSHSVWGKMYSREFINKYDIKCDETPASNDVLFSGLVGIHANNIQIDKNELYCCTIRKGSICTKINKKNVEARIQVALNYNNTLMNHSINVKYWMNTFGPIISLIKIDCFVGLKYFIKYLHYSQYRRLYLDFTQSGNRFIKRILGKNSDKEFRKIQSKQ